MPASSRRSRVKSQRSTPLAVEFFSMNLDVPRFSNPWLRFNGSQKDSETMHSAYVFYRSANYQYGEHFA